MATTADFRNGLCIEFNNDYYSVTEFQHVKPGKGAAFVRTKLKSLTTGKVLDNTFPAGHKIQDVRIERRKFQYLYKEEDCEDARFGIIQSYEDAGNRQVLPSIPQCPTLQMSSRSGHHI